MIMIMINNNDNNDTHNNDNNNNTNHTTTATTTTTTTTNNNNDNNDNSNNTPNLPTNIVDFRGFDSNIILNLRGGFPGPIGDFPESLSQAMLVGCNVSREIGRTLFSFACFRRTSCGP